MKARRTPWTALVLLLVGGVAPLSADPTPNTNAVWLGEDHRLVKLSSEGSFVLAASVPRAVKSLAADPLTGAIWVGHKGAFAKYAHDGSLVFSVDIPPASPPQANDGDTVRVTVDPKEGRPWVSWGRVVLALEADGQERFRLVLPSHVEDIVFNAHRREVWVATRREITLFDDDGAVLGTLSRERRPEDPPMAADPRDGSVWAASHKTLRKLGPRGEVLVLVPLEAATRDLAVDPRTGEVWITRRFSVMKLSPEGQAVLEVRPFGASNRDDDDDDDSDDDDEEEEEEEEEEEHPRRLAVDPSAGTLWAASRKALAAVTPSGVARVVATGLHNVTEVIVFADLTPPELEILFPADGAFIATGAPTLRLRYSDTASGVDPESLRVDVDGQDVSSTCAAVAGGSDCPLAGVVTLADGSHTAQARVADRSGNAAEAESRFVVDTTPPPAPDEGLIDVEPTADPSEWQVVGGPGSVEPGSTVTVRNSRTGEIRTVVAASDGSFFITIPAEQGDTLEIVATDLAGNTSAAITKTVLVRPQATEASGFIHGLLRDSRTQAPLAGVLVTLRGAAGGILTDGSGQFAFPTPGTGQFTLFFERRGYITARRDQYVISQRHATVGDVRLTAYDTRTTLVTAATGGTLTDSTGKVQAIFPPGAVSQNIEVSATYFGDEPGFPLPMPEGTVFLAGVQMTPEHTSFLRPVTLRIANDLGFDTGTPIPFAFASHDDDDPNEGFYDAGMAKVTPDGAFIELEVSHFSCVVLGAAPPPGASTGSGSGAGTGATGNQQPCNGNNSTPLSSICIGDGDVRTEQRLASVGALGGRDALEFHYSSGTASPRPVISAYSNLSTLYFPAAPVLATWKLSLEGVEREVAFQGATGETHVNFVWDGLGAGGVRVPTGAYHFRATSTGYFNGSLYSAVTFGGLPTTPTNVQNPRPLPYGVSTGGYVMINDRSASPFGAGWGLAQLERLHPQPDGSVLWTDGTGGSMVFTPGAGAGPKQIVTSGLGRSGGGIARDGAGNIYVGDFSGGITRIAPDGSSSLFATVGATLSSLAFDRTGSLFALTYHGSLFKIAPSGTASLFASGIGFDLGDMAIDSGGTVFIVDSHHAGILRVSPSGQAAIFPGYHGGNRLLTYPSGIAIDAHDNLYISNNYNVPGALRCGVSFISKISPQGGHSYYAVGLDVPRGLAFDDRGNLYVSNWSCQSRQVDIKVVSPSGLLSTVDRGYPTPLTGVSPPYGYSFDLVTDTSGGLYLTTDGGTVFRTFVLNPPVDVAVTYSGPVGDYSVLQRHPDGSFTRTLKDGTRVLHDARGLHTQTIETTGNTTTYAYDGGGRVVSRMNAVGQTWQLVYTGGGLASVTDPAGRVTLFTVDSSGDLIEVTHPDGSKVSFAYHARHLLASKTDARGFTTTYSYDAHGKATEARVPTGEKRKFDSGRVRTGSVLGTPDNPASPIREADTEDRFTDGRGFVTRYLSNGFGSFTKIVRPDGAVHEIERDQNNNPVRMKEPNGAEVLQEFDGRGNLTRYDQAQGLLYRIVYHPAFSKPIVIEDEGGRTFLAYDERGNLQSITDAEGKVTVFTVDGRGLVTAVARPDGGTFFYVYDSQGRATELTDPLGRKTLFEYDSAGNVVKLTAPGNRVTLYTHDAMNRLTSVTDPLDQTTRLAYEPACSGCDFNPALLIRLTDAKGHTTRFRYDEIGQLLETTDPLGRSRNFTYDLNRNLVSVTDAKGQTTTFEYDSLDRLIRVNRPEGPTDHAYDVVGNLLSLNEGSETVRLEYDLGNRVLKATPEGLLPSLPLNYSYDRRNLRTSLTTPWSSLGYEYDARGDLKKLMGSGGSLSYFYDPVGRRQRVTGLITEAFSYDKAGQLLVRESRAGAVVGWNYTYDVAGNRTSQVLRESFIEGLPTIQVNPENGVALTDTVILKGHTTRGGQILVNGSPIFVDFFGAFFQLLSVQPGPNSFELEARRPNGASSTRTISFTGDPLPVVRRLFSTDATGTLYGLDQSGRPLAVASDASLTVFSALDPYPTHVARGSALYAWYDNFLKRLDESSGQLVELAQLGFVPDDVALLPGDIWLVAQGPTLSRFDPTTASLTEWVSLPFGPSSTRALLSANATGEVLAGTDAGQLFRITAVGGLTEVTAALGLSQLADVATDDAGNAFCFDPVPQPGFESACGECQACFPECTSLIRLSPSNERVLLGAASVLDSTIAADRPGNLYLLDQNGLARVPAGSDTAQPFLTSPKNLEIEVLVDAPSVRQRDFGYDDIDQLTSASPGESYAYDSVGNRTTSHLSGLHVVDDANQLLEDDTFAYAYDENGNLVRRTHKATSSLTTYTWDSKNQLLRVDLPDGTVAEYAYDPLGRRIQKTVNGQVTKYLYDGLDLVAEVDGAGNVTTTYTHGPGIDEPVTMTRGGRTYTYHRDALGSITHLTDEAGAVVQRYEYDSYGNITALLDPTFVQAFAYTGREWDPETNLYYYRARYYDPRLGRFISQDPIRFAGGINFYAYTGNNPANRTDPMGLSETCVWIGGSATGAVGIGFQFVTQLGRCTDDCGNSRLRTRTCVCSTLGLGLSGTIGAETGDDSTSNESWGIATPWVSFGGDPEGVTGIGVGPGAGVFYNWCRCDVL